MSITKKNCFYLLLCFIFLSSGSAYSEKNEGAPKDGAADKTKTDKTIMKFSMPIFPLEKKKYSMRYAGPKNNIDPGIVRNGYDPNIDYKLRIIDPCTRKEINGPKEPFFGSMRPRFFPGYKK